jgi:hypothetical protein
MPWKSGSCHWTPQHGRWAVETPVLYEQAYLPSGRAMPTGEGCRPARLEKDLSPLGNPVRCNLVRWREEAEEAPSDDGLDE